MLFVFVFLQLTEIASAVEGTKAEQEKQLEHYGIFLMLFLLLIGMVSGYVLEMFHINWIAEAGGVLLVGLLAGWFVTLRGGAAFSEFEITMDPDTVLCLEGTPEQPSRRCPRPSCAAS